MSRDEHVIVTLLCREDGGGEEGGEGGEGVQVAFHYLHPSVTTEAIQCGPATRRLLHFLVMRRIRPMLKALCIAQSWQAIHDRAQRRFLAHTGARHALTRRPLPMVLLDACLIYQSELGAILAPFDIKAWHSAGVPCERCGADEWGYTSTPPKLSKRGLTRDCLGHCTAFCWACLHQDRWAARAIVEARRASAVASMWVIF